MRSKTSFFNATIFKKSIVRFWPMWAAYLIVWIVALPVSLGSELSWRAVYSVQTLWYSSDSFIFNMGRTGGLVISLVAAALVATAVWGFMYNARSASGYASLPVSRRSMFLSLVSAGLVPAVIINFIVSFFAFGVACYYGVGNFAVSMQAFAMMTLIYIFFFGFACFCAQLTGNIFALAGVYAVLNMLVFVVKNLVEYILSCFVYGFSSFCASWLNYLSPPVGITEGTSFIYEPLQLDTDYYTSQITGLDGWPCLLIYALVGIVFAALAYLIYKKHHMETAGDVVAIKILKPVFRYSMTFGCALVLSCLIASVINVDASWQKSAMMTMLVLMVIGAAIGYYGSEMLMKKSFRVFAGSVPGIGVSIAVIVVLMLVCEFDLFGIEKYTPNADKVESAYLNCAESNITDEDSIEALIALHKLIVEDKNRNEAAYSSDEYDGSRWVYINYYLESGKMVTRQYRICYSLDGGAGYDLLKQLEEFCNDTEFLIERVSPRFSDGSAAADGGADISYSCVNYREPVQYTETDDYEYYYSSYSSSSYRGSTSSSYTLSSQEAYELYTECILPDAKDGTLGLVWLTEDAEYYETATGSEVYFEFRSVIAGEIEYVSVYVHVTKNSARTLAWLEEHDIPVYTMKELGYGSSLYTTNVEYAYAY